MSQTSLVFYLDHTLVTIFHGYFFWGGGGREGDLLQISSDRDDRRIFLGLKFLIPGFLGGLASIFLCVARFKLEFFLGIQNNLKILGSADSCYIM